MTSNYPSGYDAFVDPTATDKLDSLTVPHASEHTALNDAVEAMQHTMGINPQGVFSTMLQRITNLEDTAEAEVLIATAAANAATNFSSLYLGAKSSAPALNNTGGALVSGNTYFDTTLSMPRIYTGSAWRNLIDGPLALASSTASTTLAVTQTGSGSALTVTSTGTSPAVKFTQTGTGDVLYVEDEASDTTVMRIKSDGKISIGGDLQIPGNDGTLSIKGDSDRFLMIEADTRAGVNLSGISSTAGTAPGVYGTHARGTYLIPTATVAGDALMGMWGSGHTGSAYSSAGLIGIYADSGGTVSASGVPGKLRFYTRDNAGTLAERLGIDKDGLFTGSGTSMGFWTSYTPVLSGTGWSIGTTGSVATGLYCKIGKTVHFRAQLRFGTSGATFGAGSIRISFPFAHRAGWSLLTAPALQAYGWNWTTSTWYVLQAVYVDDNTFQLYATNNANGALTSTTSTVPFTWAANHEIYVTGTYEAA